MREIPPAAVGPHVTPEELYGARRGPRSAEAERVLDHAALCAICAAEEMEQDAFDAPEPIASHRLEAEWKRFGRKSAGTHRFRVPVSRATLALAASVFVALGAGVFVLLQRPHDVVRGDEIAEFKLLWPIGALETAPEEFRFIRRSARPVQVTVFDPPQKYIWRGPLTTGDRVEFPPAERAKLVPGVDYYWVVGPEGGPVTAAEAFRIR